MRRLREEDEGDGGYGGYGGRGGVAEAVEEKEEKVRLPLRRVSPSARIRGDTEAPPMHTRLTSDVCPRAAVCGAHCII
jgi:hypothetical protein